MNTLLFFIILAALFLRLFSINAPLLDWHSLGQITEASIARNFYEQGYNILFPKIDAPGDSAYLPQAFQIYPFLVALFYKIFGVKEFIGRLVTLTFSLLSIVFTYKLSKKYYGPKIALIAAAFLTVAPIYLFYGRIFGRYEMAVFFVLAGFYYFCEWLERGKWTLFTTSAVFFALAFLVNIPALYMGLPLLYVSYKKYKRFFLFRWKLWLFAILILIPCLLWQFHIKYLLQLNGPEFPYNTYLIRDFTNTRYYLEWLKGDFFGVIAATLSKTVLTPPGFVLFLIGLLMPEQESTDYRFHFWLLAALVYFILDPYVIYSHHDYYFLGMVPIASIFIARTLAQLTEKDFIKKYKVLSSIIVFLTVYYSVHTIGYWYVCDNRVVSAGKLIEENTEKLSFVTTDYQNEGLLYYSHRKGFSIGSYVDKLKYVVIKDSPYYYLYETLKKHPELNLHGELAITYLEQSRKEGAKYFATIDFNDSYELHKYVANKYKVVQKKDNFLLANLQAELN